MDMYICENCGEVFDEPKTIYETHGLPCPPYEAWSACPNCESTNISDAKQCSHCGEWVAETREDLCDVCYGDMYDE